MTTLQFEFDAPEFEDDPRFEGYMAIEIEANIGAGSAPYSGPAHTCPSDIDYYGEPPEVEVESIYFYDIITETYIEAPPEVAKAAEAWMDANEDAVREAAEAALREAAGDAAIDRAEAEAAYDF